MLLKIVTDEELLTSQIVKTILFVVLSVGIIYNLYRSIRRESNSKRGLNAVILIILAIGIVLVWREYRIESALLKHPEYVAGITTAYCTVFARGQGIEFEYEIHGVKYINCNTFHPVSKDSIIVPGGNYVVRLSTDFPDSGRMNFRMKTE